MHVQTRRTALTPTVILCLLIAFDALSAQTPPPAERSQVFRGATTLVPVDIRVLDRSGKPVTDLTLSDFTVLENGVPQSIRHFSTQGFTAETPPGGSALTPRAGQGEAIGLQNRRIFLLVLARGLLQGINRGVDGMLHFVRERLLPQDLVAVLAWNRATEFTTDRAWIVDVLERFKRAHEGIEAKLNVRFSGLAALYGSKEIPASLQRDIDAVFGGPGAHDVRSVQPGVSPNATRIDDDNRRTVDLLLAPPSSDSTGPPDGERLGATLDALVGSSAQTMQDLGNLYAGVAHLRRIEGEKHLVFVSALGLALPRAEDDLDLASAASHARVVIDYVHTSGTPSNPTQRMFGAEYGTTAAMEAVVAARATQAQPELWTFATARTLAELTGGRFYANQFRNAATDMDHIDQATRFGYILGYYASNPSMDGKYRRIAVRVNRPGLTVLYRHGYFARPPLEPFNLERTVTYSRIAAAANYAGAVPDINVQATASMSETGEAPQKLGVRLDIRIDPSRLTFTKRGGRNSTSIELATFLLDGRDHLVGQTWKTVELTFTDERLKDVMRDGVTVPVTISVSARPKNVKIIVYDAGADLLGSVIVKPQ